MRRSQFTDNEILQLLGEASAGVPVLEICRTAGVTRRTFYRWRRRLGGLDVPAARQMKELATENLRLRGLVNNLFERLRASSENSAATSQTVRASQQPIRDKEREGGRAARIAAEKCGGAVTGRFASLRVNP
ncbi:transposase [Bradyrhizobium sp. ARR65]|uniref:transposase n=1 Tax=Bradyrhizobium sp. ARR65 TaxID=1040989 RepID=UPI000466E1E9|nr:transposase [Bradyrhizobium sp. ARR65]